MIYLDNAATARPDIGAAESAMRYLKEDFFNPSSMVREGFEIHKEMDKARASLLSHVARSETHELVFTSCGSESDNQALFSAGRRGNVVITEGEHAAVFAAAAELARRGIEVRRARLNGNGSVDVNDLLQKVDRKTSLVSVIHVNNETGAVNDIDEISRAVKEINAAAVFHSDGVQAFGKLLYRLGENIDLYSVSAHKIGGVRGIAALIRKKKCVLHPYIFGGGQEKGLRSGTENTFGIAQFALAAAAKYARLQENYRHAEELSSCVKNSLDKQIFKIISTGNCSPYIVSASARGLRGEVLLHMLDDKGVVVGTGSACSSKTRFSRVILATGADEPTADGILRISFSAETTMEETERAAEIINGCARELYEKTR